MIFQLTRGRSTSIHKNNYHKVFLSRSIEELLFCLEYQHLLMLPIFRGIIKSIYMFYLRSRVFPEKSFCVFSSSFKIVLKIMIFTSSVRFLILSLTNPFFLFRFFVLGEVIIVPTIINVSLCRSIQGIP